MKLTEKITNAKQALSDSKTRVLFLFLIGVAVMVSAIAYVKLKANKAGGATPSAAMTSAPNISSIPGVGQPTREYVKLQEQENRILSEEAAKKGTSAIPTSVRTTFLDQGVSADLSANSGAASVAGCSVDELKRARAAGVTAAELHCRGCSAAALKAAGFNAADLLAAGFSAADLKAIGFSVEDLKAAGISEENPVIVRSDAAKLSSTGECSMQKLQLARGKGVSAQDLRKIGCSAEALRAAGYTAAELKAAGFSAAELKAAGFSATDLKAAGFSAAELKDARFSAKDLMAAGFTAKELKDAGFSAGELRAAGFSADDLKAAGFSDAELKAAGFNAAELKDAGSNAENLKVAGFTDGDLIRAGFAGNIGGKTAKNNKSSCSTDSLKEYRNNGVSAVELKQMGCSLEALKAAGFSVDELKKAGFILDEAAVATVAANMIKPVVVKAATKDLCSVNSLKEARAKGADLTKLKEYGCTAADFKAAELMAAGFTADELKKAGFSAADIKAASLRLEADAKNIKEPPYSSKLTNEQMNNMTSADLDDLMKRQQALMKQQAGELFSAWSRMPSQQYVVGENSTKPLVSGLSGEMSSSQQEKEIAKNSDIYKAGTVVFGILDAEVNTDENNSPVMATIIHGPLKDSKVLGTFQRADKKVLLQFKVISIPRLTNSIGVNAVAIDPNTAKTVLASNVDNHYWLRYGTMFATSFVGGLGSAMQNAGTTVVSNANGITTAMPQLDFKQKAIVAMGNVGQQFSSVAASLINTQPTVTVKAGTSIGLLLMSDLAVPKNKQI